MISGVKIEGKKNMSITDEVVDVSNPNKVYVPLINNNVICECIVKDGKKVKKGSIIGIRKDLDFPVLSPVSGTVVGIKKCLYQNGEYVPCVVIENNKDEKIIKKKVVDDISSYTKEDFIDVLKKCAIVGMGGSDFPTYLKYKEPLDILIVNAVECEPYITADAMLVKLKAEIILETIDAVMKINNIKKCFIAYKKGNKLVRDSLIPHLSKYKNIILSPIKEMYPMGWERHIIKYILKVDYKKYPSEIGIVVNNVSTIFTMYNALKFGRGATKRIVTISGEGFNNPINVLVRVGTNMSSIIKKIGGYVNNEELKVIAGGPMMGAALPNDSVVASLNMNAITVLPPIDDVTNDCIRCGKCVKVCPARICPVFIMDNIGNEEALKELKPNLCVECGLCSYICPSKIQLRNIVIKAKSEVKK